VLGLVGTRQRGVDVGVGERGVLGENLARRRVVRDDGAPTRLAPRSLSERCSNVSPVAVTVRVTFRPP
jgi:hypothetical protein